MPLSHNERSSLFVRHTPPPTRKRGNARRTNTTRGTSIPNVSPNHYIIRHMQHLFMFWFRDAAHYLTLQQRGDVFVRPLPGTVEYIPAWLGEPYNDERLRSDNMLRHLYEGVRVLGKLGLDRQ